MRLGFSPPKLVPGIWSEGSELEVDPSPRKRLAELTQLYGVGGVTSTELDQFARVEELTIIFVCRHVTPNYETAPTAPSQAYVLIPGSIISLGRSAKNAGSKFGEARWRHGDPQRVPTSLAHNAESVYLRKSLLKIPSHVRAEGQIPTRRTPGARTTLSAA